jgi:hypothetical protein
LVAAAVVRVAPRHRESGAFIDPVLVHRPLLIRLTRSS